MTKGIRDGIRWLMSVDRGVYPVAVGAVILMAAAFLPWSQGPSNSLSCVNAAGELALAVELHWTEIAARVIAALWGLYSLRTLLCSMPVGRGHIRIAWTAAAFLLAYPCWHQYWAADQTLDKRLLMLDMNRVAGDMDANLRQQQVDWRVWQRFSGTETMLLPVFEPEEATWDLGLCLPYVWYRSVETVLGVEQSFLAFFKPVVLAGIIGAVCSVLFGLHAMCPLKFEGLRAGLAWGAISAAVFLAVPLVPRAVGEYLLIRAEQAVLRGELKNAAACFRAAERWKPSLRTSWQHDQCLGHIAKAEGAVDLPVTLLADAYDALGAGQTELAVARLHRVMTLAPDYPGARRFYGRALSVAGLHAFRTGQYGLAKEYWGESLRYLPTDPISWYGLSLVSFRSRRFEDAARYGEQIVRLQQFLGRKRLTVASQAFTAKSWAAFQQGDETTAHAMYSLSLTPENW